MMLGELGCMEQVFTVLGVLLVGKWALSLLWDLAVGLRALVWSRLWKKDLVGQYGGRWAVVTGSTDGIGKEYARQLAQAGVNVVLVSRTLDKLRRVAHEIRNDFKVETHIIQADFSRGREVYNHIAEQLKGKDIGILVNNVGVDTSPPKKILDMTDGEVWDQVNVNVAAFMAMTRLVVPEMLARGRGAVINLSSLASVHPFSYNGVYCASKVFVNFFSDVLDYEYRDLGLTVQTVRPGYVSTNMTAYSPHTHDPGLSVPTAATFVSGALASLGYTKVTSGYWNHGLQAFLLKVCNRRFVMFVMDQWHQFLLRERGKAQ